MTVPVCTLLECIRPFNYKCKDILFDLCSLFFVVVVVVV